MIEILSYKQTKIIVSKYNTEGHSPLKVIADDFATYVLKFPNNVFDKNSIVKEFLCHYFLKCWGIPTPSIAALNVSLDIIENSPHVGVRDKRLIANSVCFGSKLILNAIELNDFIEAKNKTSKKRILNAYDIFKIALFDLWIENEDRRPTNNNLILCPNNKGLILNAIDHAFTFSTLSFNQLNCSNFNFSDNDSILHSVLTKSIINSTQINRVFLTKMKELFYLCIANVNTSFAQIIKNIPDNLEFTDEDGVFLAEFLFNDHRNDIVFREFCYILNSISR